MEPTRMAAPISLGLETFEYYSKDPAENEISFTYCAEQPSDELLTRFRTLKGRNVVYLNNDKLFFKFFSPIQNRHMEDLAIGTLREKGLKELSTRDIDDFEDILDLLIVKDQDKDVAVFNKIKDLYTICLKKDKKDKEDLINAELNLKIVRLKLNLTTSNFGEENIELCQSIIRLILTNAYKVNREILLSLANISWEEIKGISNQDSSLAQYMGAIKHVAEVHAFRGFIPKMFARSKSMGGDPRLTIDILGKQLITSFDQKKLESKSESKANESVSTFPLALMRESLSNASLAAFNSGNWLPCSSTLYYTIYNSQGMKFNIKYDLKEGKWGGLTPEKPAKEPNKRKMNELPTIDYNPLHIIHTPTQMDELPTIDELKRLFAPNDEQDKIVSSRHMRSGPIQVIWKPMSEEYLPQSENLEEFLKAYQYTFIDRGELEFDDIEETNESSLPSTKYINN